ncbi:NAD-dependent epimerase/dehydratase family protein [Streptomyces sp. NPDC056244]|uniref:NAD-dependent epimerase/dehydratase family protein n=1 Tax=Streptomyces sp. NPDC056244 TaxID=3345762 RepID=UPI0035D75BE8
MPVSTVFLTGGSGYIGRRTIAALREHGIGVTALVRSDRSAETVSRLGAEPVRGGLTDTDVLREAASRADGVIHLGAEATADAATVDRGAADALQDGVGAGPYVHTGGVWVYGNTGVVVDEDAPRNPPAITAWRLANEERVLARAATGGHPVVVMPGVVYGGGGGLIEAFLAGPARESGAVPLIGDGSNHWTVVHVEDIAELFVLALDAPAGSVFAGVTEEHPTLAGIAGAVGRAAGCPGRTERLTLAQAVDRMGPVAEAFALDQRLTGARARSVLGWEPRHTDALGELAEPGRSGPSGD